MSDAPVSNPLPTPRPSPCPGLLRIVPARDGGICRIKLFGGVLTHSALLAVAQAAQTYGSGVLELTNRSNIQIRGIRQGSEEALIRHLLAAGLGPKVLESDDIRNVLISPSAGRDPAAWVDTRPLAQSILNLLEKTPTLHGLSPKFSIQLDGGEFLNVRNHPHDIWLQVQPNDPQRWLLGFAGTSKDRPVVRLKTERVVPFLKQLLHRFLAMARPGQTRMRDLLQDISAADLVNSLEGKFPVYTSSKHPHLEEGCSWPPLGSWSQRNDRYLMILLGVPLGCLNATQLLELAQLLKEFRMKAVHVTPWQGLLLPDWPLMHEESIVPRLEALGFVSDERDPLNRLIACSGSVGCLKGLADTKGDALRLAQLLKDQNIPPVPVIHLSGCERSCAAPQVTAFTLLAESPDCYNLYQRQAQYSGFGCLVGRHLTLEQAGYRIAEEVAAQGALHA